MSGYICFIFLRTWAVILLFSWSISSPAQFGAVFSVANWFLQPRSSTEFRGLIFQSRAENFLTTQGESLCAFLNIIHSGEITELGHPETLAQLQRRQFWCSNPSMATVIKQHIFRNLHSCRTCPGGHSSIVPCNLLLNVKWTSSTSVYIILDCLLGNDRSISSSCLGDFDP